MAHEFRWFVGIDWAMAQHSVCVMDAEGGRVAYHNVNHALPAIHAFVEWLQTCVGDLEAVAVGIETPRGALVATLMEHALAVFAINPKQLDRFRDRHTAAGAKDDRRDALVLADSLRTDLRAFRRVVIEDPVLVQLRELLRVEEDLQADFSRLTNRLRDQVYRMAPGLLTCSPGADEPWLWSLLELAPTLTAQRALPRRDIERLLRAHRIRRWTVDDVHRQLQMPALSLAPGVLEATQTHIGLVLPQLRVVVAQRKACASRIEQLLRELETREMPEGEAREHRDVQIVRSLPGIGPKIAATMLTEAAQPLQERDYHRLRRYAGTAPVTEQSGKRRPLVIMRRACNHRLRRAIYHWARVSIVRDACSREYYRQIRARGHSHGRALRSVVDRWFRILMAMLRDGTVYDPRKFQRSAVHLAASHGV
jgi:transposase